jgi:hypothetical protein
MTQKERVLNWLKETGSIDPLQSWRGVGVYRLGARIFDLRADGHIITTSRKTVTNIYGEKCSVACYTYHPPNGAIGHDEQERYANERRAEAIKNDDPQSLDNINTFYN